MQQQMAGLPVGAMDIFEWAKSMEDRRVYRCYDSQQPMMRYETCRSAIRIITIPASNRNDRPESCTKACHENRQATSRRTLGRTRWIYA